MDAKYYFPLIEEFSIGFRFESCIPYMRIGDKEWTENWVKHEYSLLDFEWTIHTILTQLQFDDAIRVKNLDEADIIEAGWFFVFESSAGEKTYKMFDFHLTTYKDSNGIYISNGNDNFEDECVYFQGDIRNYNELLQVMQMIGINPSENVKS
jgi:hypothetical protein